MPRSYSTDELRSCERCGKTIAPHHRRFCSVDCKHPPRVETTCEICGTVRFITRTQAANGKGRFCSPRCRVIGLRGSRRPIAERLWEKVVKIPGNDSCWEWQGYRDANGYGTISVDNRPTLVHRISYELHYGTIPPDMAVCHRCDNPSCVRPDHFFLGSNLENIADKMAKRRQARGENAGHAKLTNEQARAAIDRVRIQGMSRVAVAEEFGVSYWTICDLVQGRTWKVLTE